MGVVSHWRQVSAERIDFVGLGAHPGARLPVLVGVNVGATAIKLVPDEEADKLTPVLHELAEVLALQIVEVLLCRLAPVEHFQE